MRNKRPAEPERPIQSIVAFKSNEDLRSYLEDNPELNLSLMREKNGATLLHFAAHRNEITKMKIYIDHFQAWARHNLSVSRTDPSFTSQLRAWINVANNDGTTALHLAALSGNIEMLELLERHGANAKAVNNRHEDVLFMAVERNQLKTLAYLLEHRESRVPFNPNAQNLEGNTPLHLAARMGHLALVSYLLSLPREQIDCDATNNEGSTALMLAVGQGHKQVVKRMLSKGVNRHVTDSQEQRAIDIARAMGKEELVRILNDDFTNWEKLKIACNLKVVYEVERPTRSYAIFFLVLLHLLLIPSHLLAQVTIFNTPYVFWGLALLLYICILVLFGLLTRKHPRKPRRDIQELELPLCSQCRHSLRFNEFHCFICGVCVWRYDHHCPWINNCVSALNVGKFTLFLSLLAISCLWVAFLALGLYSQAFSWLSPSSVLPLAQDSLLKLILANAIFAGALCLVAALLLFSLLGEQLRNLLSDSTSYERAKQLKKESLLLSSERVSLNQTESQNGEEKEELEERGCFGNCWAMLAQDYQVTES